MSTPAHWPFLARSLEHLLARGEDCQFAVGVPILRRDKPSRAAPKVNATTGGVDSTWIHARPRERS